MHTTRRASLLSFCTVLLVLIGACSGGGSPVTANPEPDLSRYSSTVEGYIYQNGGPVSSARILVFDLNAQKVFFEADSGPDGKYIAGVDSGQYLVFPFCSTGWRAPSLDVDFSSYVNVSPGNKYRMDIELTDALPAGEELVFGFVTSQENGRPVPGASVSAGGRTTTTDGFGFYAMTVPAGTTGFTVTARGFFDLHRDVRDAQAAGDYFKTPFFVLSPISSTGSSIGGVVRDVYDGTGLGGVRITLYCPEDPSWVPVCYLTNLGGEYRFFNLPDRIYKLYYERPGYVAGYREGLVVKPNDDVILNVFMHRDTSGRASVWGYVNSASMPLPVGGARVSISNPLLGSYIAITQPTGQYGVEQVIPANYTITVVAPTSGGTTFYESASTFHTVVPGPNRIDFNLRFIDEGVLRGNVVVEGASGDMALPPTGVEVTAEKVGGPNTGMKFRTTTDGKGQFVFNGIPMGIYLVKATATYSSTEIYYDEVGNVAVNSGSTTVIDLTLVLQ